MKALVFAAALAFAGAALPCAAQSPSGAATVLHLLDYIAADYSNAVEAGHIKSADEYREQTEFSGQVVKLVDAMPADNPAHAALAADARKLADLVAQKADVAAIAHAASGLQSALISAYRIAVAPRRTPDIAQGVSLFAAQCSACHGALGHGDGPAAASITPPPTDFRDRERADKHSVFALYNTITLGVEGTPMRAFSDLSDDQRWALAMHLASISRGDAERSRGQALWSAGRGHNDFNNLSPVVTLSRNDVAARLGAEGTDVQSYLIAHPEAIAAARPAPLDIADGLLAESLAAYRSGDRDRASELAVQSYLDGFEMVETSLSNVDADFMRHAERAMMDYRGAVQAGEPLATVEQRGAEARAVIGQAREKLAAEGLSAPATFTAALVILVREGSEAVLVLAAIFAFLRKTGRNDAKRYVHAGWILALVLGLATWFVSSKLISISGASREVTEGVTALISAGMLLYVGFWLHDKAHSAAWQKFIKAQIGGALSGGTVSTLAMISFLAVYREMFETVLFYEALASQAGPAGHGALVAGVAVGAVLLAVVTWLILRWSGRLPIGPFFTVSAALLAILAVVFTGQGISALQEASWLSVHPFGSLRIPMLGIFPTVQTIAAQALVAAVIALGYWKMKRPQLA